MSYYPTDLRLAPGATVAATMKHDPIIVPALTRYFGRCSNRHRFVVQAACIPFAACTCDRCHAECPRCGDTFVEFKTVKAKLATTRCDDRCRRSTAPECKCECGGARHGENAD